MLQMKSGDAFAPAGAASPRGGGPGCPQGQAGPGCTATPGSPSGFVCCLRRVCGLVRQLPVGEPSSLDPPGRAH